MLNNRNERGGMNKIKQERKEKIEEEKEIERKKNEMTKTIVAKKERNEDQLRWSVVL